MILIEHRFKYYSLLTCLNAICIMLSLTPVLLVI